MAGEGLFAELVSANRSYVRDGGHRMVPVVPSRRLAVVTCMDARIDVFAMLGLDLGEAHVIRNAGARVTQDTLRSLALSNHLLGTRNVALIAHTDCGLCDPEDDLEARVTAALGHAPQPQDWQSFADPRAALREDATRLLGWTDRPTGLAVAAYLFDVETGALDEVVAPTVAAEA